ncbi:MAG: phosphotransferase [Flavobacteriales bacterium]
MNSTWGSSPYLKRSLIHRYGRYIRKALDRIRSHRSTDPRSGWIGAIGLLIQEVRQRYKFRVLAKRVMARYDLKAFGLQFICYSRNVLFRVDTDSGPYALRLDVDTARSMSEVRSELTWLQTINRNLPVTVPVPNAAKNGELIQRMKAPDLGLEATAVLFSWIEGEPMYGSVPPERMEELGEMIGRMHVHGSKFEPPRSFHLPTWRPDMVHYWLGVQHAPECLTYDRFQQVKRAATWAASEYSTVRRDLGTGIIHSDLSGQNLIVRSTDIAAIDLEACSIGPFVQDLAMTLTYFTDRADLNELRTPSSRAT